jgi:tRNA(Ile)-lysidine synthase
LDAIEKKVLQTIDKFRLISPGQTVIAAVSGGADSLAMLLILYHLQRIRKFSICVAHVNHCLRKEAGRDEKFVESICDELHLPFYLETVDVLKKSQREKISVETAGREARYQFFRKLAQEIPNSVVATAHNANDSLESFLMHWMRGSGLTGLTGIPPKRGLIIRPIIRLERREVEAYCSRLKWTPCEDATNGEDDYVRNDIRHHVVPPILKRCKLETLTRTMQILAEEDLFLQEYTAKLADTYIVRHNDEIHIKARPFCELPFAVQRRMIRMALPEQDAFLGLVHIDSILKLVHSNVGGKEVRLPGGVIARLEKGVLTIGKERHK